MIPQVVYTYTQQQTKIALANIILSLMYLWGIDHMVKGNPITRCGNSYLMDIINAFKKNKQSISC